MSAPVLVDHSRLVQEAWSRLTEAADDRGHPMHLVTVATLGADGRPDDSQEIVSEFERTLRARYAEGKLDMETLRALLAAHQDELENHPDSTRRT